MMTKRIFSALLAAALSLSLLAGCGSTSGSTASSAADGPQRYSTVFYDVFDTVTQVIAYCDSEEEFTAQMDALHADLVEYNQLYDIYNDYDGVTNIKTINDNAGIAPVTVDDKILGMLELAQTMYDTTSGKLNIALGSVLNIWHNYREAALADDNDSNNQLPTQEELDAAAQHCDIANLIIDEDAKTVYLADPAMSLDVGSVGKGYAVEQAAQAAEAEDWPQAESLLSQAQKGWEHSRTYFHTFIEHGELNEAQALFAAAAEACAQRDSQEFSAQLVLLRVQLQLLAETQSVSIKNIF